MIDAAVAKFLRRAATDLAAQGGSDTFTLKQAREVCDVIQVHGHRLAHAIEEFAHRDAAVGVVRDCQDVLAAYLPPDGIGAQEALNRLLGILDGPRGLEVAPPRRNEIVST